MVRFVPNLFLCDPTTKALSVIHGYPPVRGWHERRAARLLYHASSIVICVSGQRYFSPTSFIPSPFLNNFGTCFQLRKIYKGHTDEDIAQLRCQVGIQKRDVCLY